MSEVTPWPLFGYAPGGYFCKCSTCTKQFTGDKRAVMCLECAARAANEALAERASMEEAQKGLCRGCGLQYGYPGFDVDLLVPDEVWKQISPTGHGGGLLCPTCIVRAVSEAGFKGIRCYLVGPVMESVDRKTWDGGRS